MKMLANGNFEILVSGATSYGAPLPPNTAI